ncbi:MAG: hypothetical protein JKX81_01120 [Arenicella sp.]|nr:hypothetical protein [Arenicella sp.]
MSDHKYTGSSRTGGADTTTVDSKKPDNQQRRLLVGGSLTGVAVAMWHKPLISAIVLPAHAQTSTALTALTFFGGGAATPKGVSRSILDLLITEAHARPQPAVKSVMASIVQNEVDGTDFTVSVLMDLGNSIGDKFEKTQLVYSGSLTLGVTAMLAVSEDPCDLANTFLDGPVPPLSLTLNSVSEELAEISYSSDLFVAGDVSIPAGTGALPLAMCVDAPLPKAFARFDFTGPETRAMTIDNSVEGLAQSVLNTLIPTATAGIVPGFSYSATVVLTNSATNTYVVSVQSEDMGARWSGSAVPQRGKIEALEAIAAQAVDDCRGHGPRTIDVGISSPSSDSMDLVISVDGASAFTVLMPSDSVLDIPSACRD